MNPTLSAVGIGLGRGWTEFRHSLTRADEHVYNVLTAGVILIVLYFQRDNMVAGTSLSLATLVLPGVVGMLVAYNTALGGAFVVAFEREDGTLLRAKAAPFGVVGYITGQVVRLPLNTVLSLLWVLVPGLFLFEGLSGAGIGGWVTFLWVLALGLLATLPMGMVLGSLASNPRIVAQWVGLASAGLIAISGIFYPISALPDWLHPIVQVFPFYWLGLALGVAARRRRGGGALRILAAPGDGRRARRLGSGRPRSRAHSAAPDGSPRVRSQCGGGPAQGGPKDRLRGSAQR